MRFNGEAIFGAVDFTRGAQAAAERAQGMACKAQKSNAATQLYSAGIAVLGRAVAPGGEPTPQLPKSNENIQAVSCGELVDRQKAVSSYWGEPGRSAFLANGIGVDGAPFIDRLDGTFAAAIWRQDTEQLWLVCDRRADCRLYYRHDGDGIVFSSWLPLLENRSVEIDRQAVAEFLRFLYIAPPRTIYRRISSVASGHYIVADRAGVKSERFSCQHGKVFARQAHSQNGDKLDEFQSLMEQAVARRLGSRRAGVFLSSGVDSATVMAACEKNNPGRVEAFTIGFDDVDLDETNAARSLARQLGVPHHELRFTLDQYHDAFYRMAGGFDQPFGDPAGLPLVLASEAVGGKAEVITGGTGGDDLFGSPIPRHLWFGSQIAGGIPHGVRRGLVKLLGAPGRGEVFDFEDVEELFITWRGWRRRELGDLLGVAPNFEESGFYQTYREHRSSGPQALYDALGVFPPDDCRFESAALACLPIELPYHDADLMAYVQRLPVSLRMSEGDTKILLRRLFARYFPEGRLPEKKRYFNIPLEALMARAKFSLVHDCLAPARLNQHGLVDPGKASGWISRYIAGERSLRFKIWALIVLHAWLDARSGEG